MKLLRHQEDPRNGDAGGPSASRRAAVSRGLQAGALVGLLAAITITGISLLRLPPLHDDFFERSPIYAGMTPSPSATPRPAPTRDSFVAGRTASPAVASPTAGAPRASSSPRPRAKTHRPHGAPASSSEPVAIVTPKPRPTTPAPAPTKTAAPAPSPTPAPARAPQCIVNLLGIRVCL